MQVRVTFGERGHVSFAPLGREAVEVVLVPFVATWGSGEAKGGGIEDGRTLVPGYVDDPMGSVRERSAALECLTGPAEVVGEQDPSALRRRRVFPFRRSRGIECARQDVSTLTAGQLELEIARRSYIEIAEKKDER